MKNSRFNFEAESFYWIQDATYNYFSDTAKSIFQLFACTSFRCRQHERIRIQCSRLYRDFLRALIYCVG